MGSRRSDREQSSSGIDPQFREAFFNNLAGAQDRAAGLQPQQVAQLGQNWQAGVAGLQNAMSGPGMQSMNWAANQAMQGPPQAQAAQMQGNLAQAAQMQGNLAQGGGPVSAAQASAAGINRGDIGNVQGGNFLQGNIGSYMNPFTEQVIDRSMGDLDRARQMTMNNVGDRAAAAGAFGGSRHGVAESETNRAFMDQAANLSAGLRSQGFDTGAALMQQDMSRGLQAGLANQQQDAMVAAQNAGFGQTTGLSNQQALNQMALANQANQTQLGLADQGSLNQAGMANMQALNQMALANQGSLDQAGMANMQAQNQMSLANQQAALQNLGLAGTLGNQMFGAQLQGAGALQQAGMTERDIAQQGFDAQFQLPFLQQGLLNDALGVNPGGGAGMQSQSIGAAPDRFGQVLGAGGAILGGMARGGTGFFSDRRLKQNIVKVGVDENTGLNLYDFNYVGGGARYRGVMADEVEKAGYGSAVIVGQDGYKRVNYDALGLQMQEVA